MNINLDPNATSGEMLSGDVAALQKALETGYGTDVAQLQGGGALRIQSLDKTMQAVIVENQHFRLFNKLPKPKIGATVDEWTEQRDIGGAPGTTANTETGNIAGAQGEYARQVGMAKYLMTRREISFVLSVTNNIADAEAVEYANGALQLLRDAEYLCFEGDSQVVPTEFDGIEAQLRRGVAAGQVSGDNIIDLEGGSLDTAEAITRAAATISGDGNYGTPTDMFNSVLTQSDLDLGLSPQWRVALTGGQSTDLMTGAPVVGVRTSWGNIAANPDIFVRDEQKKKPWDVMFPGLAVGNAAMKPTALGATAAADASGASKFGAVHAGNYYYAVAALSNKGQTTVLTSAQVAVAAGNKVTLEITGAVGGTETGYVIYRGRKNGTNAPNDLREMVRIPKAGPTTTWVDQNRRLPGATKAFILNLTPGATAINWRQLLPMVKFPLYPTHTAVIPWAQMLFGYLRISKRRHHVLVDNIITKGQVWKPFG